MAQLDLSISSLDGEVLYLRVCEDIFGYELLRLVRRKVSGRAGRAGSPSILVGEKQLSMTETLKEQGVLGALCLIWLPSNAFKAFQKLLNPDSIDDGLDSLDGMTSLCYGRNSSTIKDITLPLSLERLSFGSLYNQSLRDCIFPPLR